MACCAAVAVPAKLDIDVPSEVRLMVTTYLEEWVRRVEDGVV